MVFLDTSHNLCLVFRYAVVGTVYDALIQCGNRLMIVHKLTRIKSKRKIGSFPIYKWKAAKQVSEDDAEIAWDSWLNRTSYLIAEPENVEERD